MSDERKPISKQAEHQRRTKLGLVPVRGWVLSDDKPKADKLTERGEAAYAAKYETKGDDSV